MNEMPLRHDIEQRYFPDGVDRIQLCCADYSIPTLDTITTHKNGNGCSTQQLFQLLESQTVYEKLAWAETESSIESLGHAQESIPPQVCHEFQASRLFLSHFGFLSIKNNSNNTEPTDTPLLTGLDMKKSGFSDDLLALDKMSSRTCDTVHIFYVKVGQSIEADIIGNTSEENVNTLDSNFWNMLNSLGWAVNVKEHAGWSGLVNRNLNHTVEDNEHENNFNGDKKVIYWADVGAEIAFVLPTIWNRIDNDNTDGICISLTDSSKTDNSQTHWYERSVSEAPTKSDITSKMLVGQKTRCLSLDLDRSHVPKQYDPVAPKRTKSSTSKPFLANQAGAKVFLVWLESFEDYLTFPIGK